MANGYPWLVLAPVLGLATYCLCHLVLARVFVGRSPYLALVAAFVPGLGAMVVVSGLALAAMQAALVDVVGYGLLNLATYGALGWGYFHFVNLCIASLRIRVLEEIVEAGGSLPGEHLLARYNTDGMIAMRIERLVGGGHLVVREARYYRGKPQFLLIARVFDLLRYAVMGPNYLPLPETDDARRDALATTSSTES
jgi:hypothetical protein